MQNISTRLVYRFRETFKPRTNLEAQNAWNLYGDIAWFGVLSGIAGSFLSVYVLRVGGSDVQVGLLSALPALVAIFVSIPGSRMVEREKTPLSIMLSMGIFNRLGYLGIAFVPLLFSHQADAIVLLVGLLTIPGAIANVAFTTMFALAVSPEHRAHVVAVRSMWIGIVSTLIAFFGGKFLEAVVFPTNYQILFFIAFAGSMVSAYYLARIRLPVQSLPHTLQHVDTPRRWHQWMAMLRESRAFTEFSFSAFIFHWGLYFPAPLYTIYWVRVLQASEGWIGVYSMVNSATTIVFYPLWGRLANRRGNLLIMVLSTLGLAIYPIATAFSPTVEWIMLVSFVGGIFNAGYGLAFFNRLLEVTPERRRPSHIAVYNTLTNVTAFAGPLISTLLIPVFNLQLLLIAGTLLRLWGGVLFWRQHRRSR